MKILITGAKGQLGLELNRQLVTRRADGETVEIVLTDLPELDIASQPQVTELLQGERPQVVLNCAAYTNVDGCEADEDAAFRINALGARNLAVAAAAVGAKMVQVSTDYVFDGANPAPRREYDQVNPQSVYGRSKLWGEQLVAATNPRHFIVRTAWLYGEGNNFVRTMLRLATEREELQVVNDQIGSPTSTVDLTRCLLELIRTEAYGVYHATCEGRCSWYEFASKIMELTGRRVKLTPITTEQLNRPAPRPRFSVLDNFALRLIGLNTFRDWESALREYLGQAEGGNGR
jgi:dTDP-4-dehydrorhamnose reductase